MEIRFSTDFLDNYVLNAEEHYILWNVKECKLDWLVVIELSFIIKQHCAYNGPISKKQYSEASVTQLVDATNHIWSLPFFQLLVGPQGLQP